MMRKSIVAVLFLFGINGLLWIPNSLAGTGYLDIVSHPEGVNIFVNGTKKGETPLTGLEVPSGKVNIKAKKENYGTATKTVNIGEDELRRIKIELQKSSEKTGTPQEEIVIEQDTGELLVINETNSGVFIDSEKKGQVQ